MRSAIVIGDPRPRSGIFRTAADVAATLTGTAPDLAIDLVDIGPALLNPEDRTPAALAAELAEVDIAIFASPVRHGSYTGLLKLFMDRIPDGSMARVTGIVMMVGADSRHTLAPEIFLKPALGAIGVRSPASGLFLVESEIGDHEVVRRWLDAERRSLPTELAALRI